MQDGVADQGRAEAGDDADDHVRRGVEVRLLLDEAQGLVAERAVRGEGAAEAGAEQGQQRCRNREAGAGESGVDANLIDQCRGYLHGIPGASASSVAEQLDSTQGSLQELAQVVGLPPVRLK